MIDIRPARYEDAEAVSALLHENMNRKIAPERWRRLFAYRWLEEKPDFGRVAFERDAAGGERLLGFVGAVYADREIAGRMERLVNICAWWLHRDCRGQGVGKRLMADVTADPANHYTIMTSSSKTLHILDAVGYRVLDDRRYDWRRRGGPTPGLSVERDPERIRDRVGPAQLRLLDDHRGLPARPILFEHEEGRTLAFFSVVRKGADQTWWDVLHVSDTGFLARYGQAAANALLPDDDARLSADARFCAAPPPEAETTPLEPPRFVKSARLSGAAVDHLYTELQLLDLKLG